MATGRITKRVVDALAPDTLLWDAEVRGFAVRRRASDGPTYWVKYRTANRRQRWYRIGGHGSPWTPDTARADARQVLAAVARGHDPVGARQNARDAFTVGELLDRFLADHVDTKLRATTRREYRRMITATLRPALGAIPVAAVNADDVARLHRKLKETPILANRAVVILAKALAMAERWSMRPLGSNPARGIEKYREVKRTRRLSLAEVQRLGTVLALADVGPIDVSGRRGTTTHYRVSPFALAAIRLLLLTGARKGEVLNATWDMVDRTRAVLRLPDSKSGAKDILLPAPALAVLDGLVRIEDNPYLVPGAREGQPLVNISKPLAEILRVARLDGVTLHTLRHTFGSVGADEGLSLPVIGRLLGHTQAATTQRYSHVSSPLRAAGELVAERIASALSGGR